MPADLVKEWKSKGVKVHQTENLERTLPKVDVLYVTRIQKEWFKSKREYKKISNIYILNKKLMKKAKKKMIIMHPLPRVNEISSELDNDPRAVYFQQMRNGLYVRMALLKLILKGKK
jgi:aspartate carbamoyltransferase catalytic subunit